MPPRRAPGRNPGAGLTRFGGEPGLGNTEKSRKSWRRWTR